MRFRKTLAALGDMPNLLREKEINMSVTQQRGRAFWTGSEARRELGGEVDKFFASLGRDGPGEVEAASRVMSCEPLVRDVIDAIPLPVSILNEKGQVILTNRQWDRSLDADPEFSLGKRHGELFECVHRDEGPDGCATSAVCGTCGAAECIFESRQSREPVTREYHLHRETPEGTQDVERHVTAGPIHVDGREFTVFVVNDESS